MSERERERERERGVDLKSSGNLLAPLVEQSQLRFDGLAVAAAVSNDLDGCVADCINLRDELIVFTLQSLYHREPMVRDPSSDFF